MDCVTNADATCEIVSHAPMVFAVWMATWTRVAAWVMTTMRTSFDTVYKNDYLRGTVTLYMTQFFWKVGSMALVWARQAMREALFVSVRMEDVVTRGYVKRYMRAIAKKRGGRAGPSRQEVSFSRKWYEKYVLTGREIEQDDTREFVKQKPLLTNRTIRQKILGHTVWFVCTDVARDKKGDRKDREGKEDSWAASVATGIHFGTDEEEQLELRFLRPFVSQQDIDDIFAEIFVKAHEVRERRTGDTTAYMPRSTMKQMHQRDQGRSSAGYIEHEWERMPAKPSRSLDTVILPQEAVSKLKHDVGEFLESEKWYNDRGIPYRRGYLLHGIPGSGKTSSVFALAGHFSLSIYVIRLSDPLLTDEGLYTLFSKTKRPSIILLEDVDSPGAPQMFKEVPSESPSGHAADTRGLSVQATASLLDGLTAADGRLIFMTCRDKNVLNQTLTRPGRFDVAMSFDYPTREQVERFFLHFYDGVSSESKLSELAKDFAELTMNDPKPKSMAALQVIFLTNKTDPESAVDAMRQRLSARARASDSASQLSDARPS